MGCMGYIAAGIGKVLSSESLTVYFDCLGDLPVGVLQLACKRVVLEHKWATFPTVAEIREAATKTSHGELTELSPAEAWQLAWRVVANTDPEIDGSFTRATAGVPDLVVRSIRAMGLTALCYGEEPVGVVRAQFIKVYEQLAARKRTEALMPASVRQAIEGIGKLPPEVRGAIAGIGEEP